MFANKKIVILGGKESGVGAAILAKKMNYNVFLSDQELIPINYKNVLLHYDIFFEEGGHNLDNILTADVIVISPGIPSKSNIVKEIEIKKIKIISELEFAFLHKNNSKILAVTGTNGKSTTSTLLFEILKEANYDCALVGNIGDSICQRIALNPVKYYVTEVSSFQLDYIDAFKPDIAILLNITPDHLDRYEFDFNKYITAKAKIIKNQTSNDYFIFNYDDQVIQNNIINNKNLTNNLISFSMKKQGVTSLFIDRNKILRANVNAEVLQVKTSDIGLSGNHNYENVMAATGGAMSVGVQNNFIMKVIKNFKGLSHRLEYVGCLNQISFINDSKSTNVNCTWYALETMKQPTILILGGKDKMNDYSILDELVSKKVKAIVCLGKDNKKIIQHFKNIIPEIFEFVDMNLAVEKAFNIAQKNQTVLLSPACASFDLFDNYEDRGNQFKKAVKRL